MDKGNIITAILIVVFGIIGFAFCKLCKINDYDVTAFVVTISMCVGLTISLIFNKPEK